VSERASEEDHQSGGGVVVITSLEDRAALIDRGFVPSDNDECLFIHKDMICIVYVDDCLFCSRDNAPPIDAMIESLREQFDLNREDDVVG
jgi:glyoxylase-like metal-dependent hydrolase (beta-lactamase superfamily II)